jgi:asparagine synthase (glutamine-hydrolysing)
MCGFVGVFNPKKLTTSEELWISQALSLIKHRGPDDSGRWTGMNHCVSLGHQRLAVIDLTNGGHQPMHSQDQKLHLVFNGEIYNYVDLKEELESEGFVFFTNSDTEVLLNAYLAWEDECVNHLNGQFAFGILDENKGQLFLARDRAGEKPMYFAQLVSGSIIFGSELKTLAHHPETNSVVDIENLREFLTRGQLRGERSILKGIQKLLPAHTAIFNLKTNHLKVSQYWKPRQVELHSSRDNLKQLSKNLEVLLTQAVERQFVSDVPVGVLLSGGLDSSIVTAIASKSQGSIQTFTAVFSDSRELNEAVHAKLVADHFDTIHHEVEILIPPLEVLEFLGSNFDEPIFDPSIIPTYLLSKEIKKFCTVALGGDGADELFGGYKHYSRALQTLEIQSFLPIGLRKVLSLVGSRLVPLGKPGHARFRQLIQDHYPFDPQEERMFELDTADSILGISCERRSTMIPNRKHFSLESDLVTTLCNHDFYNYLPNDILVKIDRCSMLSSLEMRSPFLDMDVMNFALGLVPGNLKATKNKRKILLNDLGRQILPREFDFERKLGFIPPTTKWGLTHEWQEFMKSYLLSEKQNVFEKPILKEYFADLENQPLLVDRLLMLTLFEIWRQKNVFS